ncbi:biotin-dependent carboxyltransferase family protein [Robertkochia aurantiaca]|uniref:5-oxoprolinase subunit C family protein n=1 Tax=Robertkochia aurantiaca TaxID=2873700 RepID=UPI001CCC58A3|nr:biotin-dependent carboxyltransferase family protein [Robertkochia sp. 3YJGBD-33]
MIKVLEPGLFSTIQDLGRKGYRDKGVPLSGAMDSHSAALANTLVGNPEGAAVMETTMTGPKLQFDGETVFAITGGSGSLMLNGEEIQPVRAYKAKRGDILDMGRSNNGLRAYLAVRKGFRTVEVLGSRSWYVPLTPSSHLKKGDILPVEVYSGELPKSRRVPKPVDFSKKRLKACKGPEFTLLSTQQQRQLKTGIFTVAKENNRMACQLNENLLPHEMSILTSATLPGTVQLTPAGKMIILMRDAQTTGGYPRILQLEEEAICLLAQKHTGEEIMFSF